MNEYRISENLDEMDFQVIHQFIKNSYWAKNIPSAVLKKALSNSMCFAVLTEQNQLVGFARLITDQATFAYLADVFVLESHRGQGLSTGLMQAIVDHPQLKGLRRALLATSDAHGLYEKFGFKPLSQPGLFMERWDPDVYLKE